MLVACPAYPYIFSQWIVRTIHNCENITIANKNGTVVNTSDISLNLSLSFMHLQRFCPITGYVSCLFKLFIHIYRKSLSFSNNKTSVLNALLIHSWTGKTKYLLTSDILFFSSDGTARISLFFCLFFKTSASRSVEWLKSQVRVNYDAQQQ